MLLSFGPFALVIVARWFVTITGDPGATGAVDAGDAVGEVGVLTSIPAISSSVNTAASRKMSPTCTLSWRHVSA